jgi:hypothetical protein
LLLLLLLQVKTLFAVAGVMQPSVIFIDEIDSILSARKSEGACTSCSAVSVCVLVCVQTNSSACCCWLFLAFATSHAGWILQHAGNT